MLMSKFDCSNLKATVKRTTENVQLVLLQNELNSVVARFTTLVRTVLQQKRIENCCCFFFFVGGKTRNIAIQLVLQQCCKTNCTFLLPVLVPYLY